MSEHKVTVAWKRSTPDFQYATYNREHTWSFGGGHTMRASSAPEYLGNHELVNPEEAFVASVSSCHMLTFLAVAAKKRLMVDDYVDDAVGILEKNEHGRLAITRITLKPQVTFSGATQAHAEEMERLHHAAHEACFIANSVKTQITVSS